MTKEYKKYSNKDKDFLLLEEFNNKKNTNFLKRIPSKYFRIYRNKKPV